MACVVFEKNKKDNKEKHIINNVNILRQYYLIFFKRELILSQSYFFREIYEVKNKKHKKTKQTLVFILVYIVTKQLVVKFFVYSFSVRTVQFHKN